MAAFLTRDRKVAGLSRDSGSSIPDVSTGDDNFQARAPLLSIKFAIWDVSFFCCSQNKNSPNIRKKGSQTSFRPHSPALSPSMSPFFLSPKG